MKILGWAQALDNRSDDHVWTENGPVQSKTEAIQVVDHIHRITKSAAFEKRTGSIRLLFTESEFVVELPVNAFDIAGRRTGITLAGDRVVGASGVLKRCDELRHELGETIWKRDDTVDNLHALWKEGESRTRPKVQAALVLAMAILLLIVLIVWDNC